MRRSTDRILTTHVGSLVRTHDIIVDMKARTIGEPLDPAQLEADVRSGIADVVKRQLAAGIDIPNDGEYWRRGFVAYIHERLSGLAPRAPESDERVHSFEAERVLFPEFFDQYYRHYRQLWMPPDVSLDDVPVRGDAELFRLTTPIGYAGQDAVQRDIDTLKVAIGDAPVADAFLTAVAPTARKSDRDVERFYGSEHEYLYALADALREEYRAITDAGLILQVDWAALNPQGQLLIGRTDASDEEMRRAREVGVEVLNHALAGIPEAQVRYHHCWGSNNRPHTTDTSLEEILPQLLKIRAQAYVIEAANPRHEHEWQVWQDVKLPDGKILIPGVISQSTNVVEHPELVAWRLRNFASVVGKENVIAGTDCGFSQFWDSIRVHPSIQWAKLQALSEGAALASTQLWA